MPTKFNIYNATGYPLKFRRNFDISGTISNDAKAPQEISNGKWESLPMEMILQKRVLHQLGAYAEIRQYGGFDDVDWVDIQQTLVNGSDSHGDHHSGCWSVASITKSDPSNGVAEELDAIITSPKNYLCTEY
ncbi:hypothetical protein ACFE04_014870 [Oxalis oulophora]